MFGFTNNDTGDDRKSGIEIDQFKKLLEISRGLLTSYQVSDRQSLYGNITTRIHELFHCELVTFFETDKEDLNSLYPVCQIPDQPIKKNLRLKISDAPEAGLTSRIAFAGKSVILNGKEIDENDRTPDYLKSGILNSLMIIPLQNRKGKLLGLLRLQNKHDSDEKTQCHFTVSDQSIVELLSIEIVSVIENFEFQEGTRNLIGSMQDAESSLKVVEAILDRGMKLLQADFGKLTLWSRLKGKLMVAGAKRLGEPFVYETDQFVDPQNVMSKLWDANVPPKTLAEIRRIEKESWLDFGPNESDCEITRCCPQTRSSLSMILRVHHQPIGVLHFESCSEHFFDEHDLSMLKALAQYISTAIQSRDKPWGFDQKVNNLDWDMWSLGHSKGLYHSIVRHTPLVMWRKDLEGNFVWVNEAFCKTLGKTKEEIIGKNDFALFPAENAKRFLEGDRIAEEQGYYEDAAEPYRIEGDSEEHFIHVVKIPFYDQFNLAGTQGIFLDSKGGKYQQLFNQLPVGFHELDAEGRVQSVNKAERELLGYAEEEMEGKHYWEFSSVREKEILKDVITKQLNGADPDKDAHPFNLKTKSGEIVPVVFNSRRLLRGRRLIDTANFPLVYNNTESSGLLSVIREVSTGVHIEESLRYPDSSYLSHIKELDLPVFCLNDQLRVQFANDAYLRRDNMKLSDVFGKTGVEIYGEAGKAYHEDSNYVLETGEVLDKVEYHVVDEKRELVRLLKFPIRDANNDVIGVQGVFWAYEEQEKAIRQLSAALDAALEDYRQIVHRANEGFFQSKLNGNIISANPAMVKMMGYNSEQDLLTAKNAGQDRFAEAQEQDSYFNRVLEAKEGETLKLEYRMKGGKGVRWVRESVQIRDDPNLGRRLIGFVEDIHEQKDSLEVREELVRMLAHQLRSPAWQAYERVNSLVTELDPHSKLFKNSASPVVGKLATIRGLTRKTRGVAWSTEIMSELAQSDQLSLPPKEERNSFLET